jgi:phage tail sheath protein FI
VKFQLRLVSGTQGESSRVRVLPGPTADVSAALFLGAAAGGIETEGAAQHRPADLLPVGRLIGDATGVADFVALPSAAAHQINIALDGGAPTTVSLGTTPATGATPGARLRSIAERLQNAVTAAKPTDSAFKGFICRVDSTQTKLILVSGTQGGASAVAVTAAPANSIANELKLLAGTTVKAPDATNLTGGNDDPPQTNMPGAILRPRSSRQGLYALEAVDLFNILCVPGVTDPGVLAEAVAYCDERRAFLLVDPPSDQSTPDKMEKVVTGPTLPKSDHAAVYFPWLKIPDPLRNGKLRTVAPCGTVAGLYARTDSTRGVWKAPAGTDATMLGVQATDYPLTDPENGVLNPRGVNCLRIFPTYGPLVWGARTLRGDDDLTSEYKYVPVRRLALYLEESLFRGLKWVVFEPNDEPLWAQIRLNVGAFLQTLFRQGAFQGKSPREAYFVKCDAETTTQTDINLGRVNIVVGFAPLKPAEFVVVSIQQMAGQIAT